MNSPLNKFELVILRTIKRGKNKESIHWSNFFRIDGQIIPMGVIDYWELIRSLTGEGEFFMATCSCGEPGCAGIHEGIEVRHINGRTSWRMNFEKPVLKFAFDTAQYHESVYEGLLAWRKLVTQKTGWLQLGPLFFDRKQLDDCLREAAKACGKTMA